MSTPTRFGIQGLMPAFSPELAVTRDFSLPFGGPTDGTGKWAQGLALGCVGVAAQSEVVTLSITGSPTGGTFTPTVQGAGIGLVSLGALAFNVSLANFQAALVAAVPEWAGNVTVTGTPGTTYTCTFNTNLANQRIGCLFAVTAAFTGGSTPAAAWARTTRGSCGVAQMDAYSQGSNNSVDGFLKYDTTVSPGGALIPVGVASSLVALNQPFQPTVYVEGIFTATDLTGLDSNAYTLGKLTKIAGGNQVRLV